MGNIYIGNTLLTGDSKVIESSYPWFLPKLSTEKATIELSSASGGSFLNTTSAADFKNKGYKAYTGDQGASNETTLSDSNIAYMFCQPNGAEATSGSSPSTNEMTFYENDYVILELPTPQRVSQISATALYSFNVYGSNDKTNWTSLGSIAGTSTYYTKYLTITNTTAWKYFKFLNPNTAASNATRYLGAVKFKKIYTEAIQKNILTCSDIVFDESKNSRFMMHTPTGILTTTKEEHPLSNSTYVIPTELRFKNMTMSLSGDTVFPSQKYEIVYTKSTSTADTARFGGVSVKTGTIASGGTIPKTAGYNNYCYFASINSGTAYKTSDYSTGDLGDYLDAGSSVTCTVNQSTRVVTCSIGIHVKPSSSTYATPATTAATANYMEIAWN